MFCWGNTSNGELGLGGIEEDHILTPRELIFTHANSIRAISCGKNHTLVVTLSGEVYSCGNNDHNQLGHNKPRTKLHPVEGLEAYRVKNVSCGENFSMALSEWGQVFTWGGNTLSQLGADTGEETLSKPKIVKKLATVIVVQVACGYNHCLALTNKGELYTWGSNENGQLGLGLKDKSVREPSLVSSLIGLPISLIACGASHSFAVSRSGAVYGWGRNRFGQLGLNSQTDHIYPCQLKTLRSIKVKYISCGEDFSVFLTQDGGVLTCGAGMYGQLGHGSTSNEVLPRKILELMGSTVTQICCGRRHTLAYLPSRDRVYAFGLGGAGQLGTKQVVNYSSPQVVLGPWLDMATSNTGVNINKLYAGGDHCFVTVTPKHRNIPSEDFRVLPQDSQVWVITLERMLECEAIPADSPVDQELMTYLETVLSSQCCINGSFLQKCEMHYCCTSRHHGLDMAVAENCFKVISRSQNESIKNLVYECITQIIQSLSPSPPDVETLRIYVTLPLYHEFDNIEHPEKLQGPFAAALLCLKKEAAKIVGNWYYSMSSEYFERLIRIYKGVVILLLKAMPVMGPNNQWDLTRSSATVITALELLSKLHTVNQLKTSELKVNYDSFYLPELQDTVDIRLDYLKWLSENKVGKSGKPYLCNYPFLFDAEAKTLLLQTDQSIQMHSAVNEATQRALAMMFLTASSGVVQPLMELSVSRENIVSDTIRELSSYSEKDFKKPLKAEDAGGVKKEFFLLLLREILDPKYGMFTSDPETNAIWFSEDSFEDEIMYYLVGLLCGLAIYNFIIINLPFPLALYKKLLGKPVGLDDLKDLTPSLAKGLNDLLEYDQPDVEDVFCLKFELSREVYGEVRTCPLKSNGSEIPVTRFYVTFFFRKEYVDLYVDYILNKGVERHFTAFRNAFLKVCGGRVLELFHPHELMAVVIGNENYDWDIFEKNTSYKGGYTESDPTVRMFWEVFHDMSLDDKKKFLVFLTGTDRIPLQGMKAVKIIIQPTLDDKFLPVAHTCFNLLDLPRYSTKERLRYKLYQSIQQTQGFNLV
ncbi:hypothetical protein AAG570_003888 [Ranatra chinensis]|uniref:HECT domain-containing protein n=1 Tax=Ranatra chinensis TaxID=642074 RepID=A0ABD0YES3_9HEMI